MKMYVNISEWMIYIITEYYIISHGVLKFVKSDYDVGNNLYNSSSDSSADCN